MSKCDNLYNIKPPSTLKSKEDPFIPSQINSFWVKIFNAVFGRMIQNRFYSVRIKNLHYYLNRDPECANIIYAPHQCWWDGMIGYYLCRKVFNTEMHMMIEQLHKMPLLSRIGAYSVCKKSAQSSMKALKYSIEILGGRKNSVWLFPQGIVHPPDSRPVKFSSGISYLCQKAKKVNLIPVGIRYHFLREDRPEVLIEIGKPIKYNANNQDRRNLTSNLEDSFTEFLDNQRCEISNGQLEEYEVVLSPKLSAFNKFEKFIKSF